MKHFIVMVCCFALASVTICYASDVRLVMFRSDTGVHLRWIGNTDAAVSGWWVERSVNNAPFVRIAPEPTRMILSYAEMKQYVGQYMAMYYLTLFGVTEPRDLTVEDVRKTLQSSNVSLHFAFRAAAPELAILSGEYYFDRNPPDGEIRYRIIPILENAELSPTKSFTLPATQTSINTPTDLTAAGMDHEVQLFWNKEDTSTKTEIVGFRVWRGATEHGDFSEATQQVNISVSMSNTSVTKHTWYDNDVKDGDTLYYFIRYIHATGMLSNRSNIVRAIVGSSGAPMTPQQLYAERFGHAVKLLWKWSWLGVRPERVVLRRSLNQSQSWDEINIGKHDTSYIDALAVPGNVYQYSIVSYSLSDSATSDTATFVLTDVVSPEPPTHVFAKSDTAKITIRWTKSISTDVDGYIVSVATDVRLRHFYQVGPNLIKDTVFVDTVQREAEGQFAYKVVAVDTLGNASTATVPIVARPLDLNRPAPPQIVECTRKKNRVTLQYTASASKDVAAYVVQRNNTTNTWIDITETSTFLTTDSIAGPGTYRYRVIAIDSSGNRSKPSEVRTLTIAPELSQPATLAVTLAANGLALSWSGVEGAAGYEIARIDTTNGRRTILDNVGAEVMQWTDLYADTETVVVYEVAARSKQWRMGPYRRSKYTPSR